MNRFENIKTAVISPHKGNYLEYKTRRDALIVKLTKARSAKRKEKIRAELEQLMREYGEVYETRGEVRG